MTIHFVCAGNTFRSRLAEAYLKSLKIPGVTVMSSGYKADHDEDGPICFYTKAIAKAAGLMDYMKPHWDQLTQERLDAADIVVTLNRAVYEHCYRDYKLPKRVYIWDVPDVVYPPTADDPKTDEEILEITFKTFAGIKQHVDELVFFLTRKKPTKPIDILQEDGTPTGKTATIEEIHEQGLWRQAVHVGLYTPYGEILMQKRSDSIVLSPGQWDIGYAGSANSGETPLQAALREGHEELGIHFTPAVLKPTFTHRYSHYLPHYAFHERCIIHVFLAPISGHERLALQRSEVARAEIVPIPKARELLALDHPLYPKGFNEKLLTVLEQATTR